MIKKLLVANRGEIAIRAFRAATELGIRTVAVYAFEDRHSLHRQKADESYQIGADGRLLRAYLDVAAIIEVALRAGADAIYPGYGFLSENPELAEACVANNIDFVGPSPSVLSLAGDKVRALRAARDASLPTLPTSEPLMDVSDALARAEQIGFPLFVKASAGGGGRGLRKVHLSDDLPSPVPATEDLLPTQGETQSAFGRRLARQNA